MTGLVLLGLALIFIWISWGFWAFFWFVVAFFVLGIIFRPKYSYDTNWGAQIAKYGIVVFSFFAIQQQWEDSAVTAVAVAVAIFLEFSG